MRPGCQIDHNNQTRLGLGDRVAYVDNVDIEALPTGGWGYHYFPVNVRYSRTFGRSFYGLTGRFQESWADFGGLKHPRQLAVELASIVAQGAHCSVGDQAPPSGRLDRAVYEAVGQAYAGIERIEALLEAAAPVVEAAIVVDGEPLLDIGETHFGPGSTATLDPMVEGVVGLTELLVDQRVQFDIVEPRVDLDRYRLVVVPDGTKVGPPSRPSSRVLWRTAARCSLLGAPRRSGGITRLWLPGFDVQVAGRSPFVPAYLLPGGALLATLANFEYALYTGTFEWRVQGGDAEVWARVGVPAFQRGPEHYTSHVQSPFSRATDMAAVVRSGKVGATSFEMGAAYRRTGYWVYREIFAALLDAVLPQRLVRANGPRSAEISLTQQQLNGKERWLVHIVNGFAGRRWGPRLERFEDSVPLPAMRVTLDLPGVVRQAWQGGSGEELVVHHLGEAIGGRDGGRLVEVEVPPVDISSIVVLEP